MVVGPMNDKNDLGMLEEMEIIDSVGYKIMGGGMYGVSFKGF